MDEGGVEGGHGMKFPSSKAGDADETRPLVDIVHAIDAFEIIDRRLAGVGFHAPLQGGIDPRGADFSTQ